MTFDQPTRRVTVEALEDFMIGSYRIEARVSLDNYPMVQKTMTFLIVDITACVVLDMHQTPVAD